ncbi:MAG TPA: potassium transporter Kup [Solirubrobacteraceae bacterium]|nr:potassium transporter Kup [Solirubrobacteraceae bacterium]
MADASAPPADDPPASSRPSRGRKAVHGGLAALTLGALGVVFGDIGTSPLYALQTVFTADHHAVHASPGDVYGVISLVFWSITMVVSVKYVTFIMRADNGGEGGIMALTALLQGARLGRRRAKLTLVTLGVLGASLFYGDGMITPAISVLSAVEGLKVAAPGLGSLVLPITVGVITGLFMIQHRGTGAMGRLFGPIMALWFGVLAIFGAVEIAGHPGILKALSPSYGVDFFSAHAGVAFIALGSVVLAVTGAEALYADMGHFGRRPISRAWFFAVFPALTLNYLGQGALILDRPSSVANPFYLLAPDWTQIPLVILATVATVIASQSAISGAFSVTNQAVQLGFLPRLTIRHTSEHEIGQVYAPGINWALFVAVLGLVLGFGSSAALANAYGVAVTGTFILNTILFLAVARFLWRKPVWMIGLGGTIFLTIEVAFFAANLEKVAHGGWLPLALAAVVFTLLMTWHEGQQIVTASRAREEGPLLDFVTALEAHDPPVRRVPGTAVFPTADADMTPLALRANVEHNHVLHENVIIISLRTERVPHVPRDERLVVDELGDPTDGIVRLSAHFGFQDAPYIPATLRLAADRDLLEGDVDIDGISYFLSQITIVRTDAPGMSAWRKRVFLAMAHNAGAPVNYFGLPDTRTVIMGERVEL